MDSGKKGEGSTKSWKPNGFTCFIQENIKQLQNNGFRFGSEATKATMKDLTVELSMEYEELSPAKKRGYEEKARKLFPLGGNIKDDDIGGIVENLTRLASRLLLPDAVGKDIPDRDLIIKYWSHPQGRSTTAIVIQINHYVDRDQVNIPCEIGMTAFSVEDGLLDSYWTLVNPEQIPLGYGIDAANNSEKFGVPLPSDSKNYKDYEKMVSSIEKFIMKFVITEAKQPFVFCLRQKMQSTQAVLNWLYNKAGKRFERNVYPLELLLVVMSLSGLHHRAEAEGCSMKSVVSRVEEVVRSCHSTMDRDPISIENFVSQLGFSSVSLQSYSQMGNIDRVAATKQTTDPLASLGMFLCEKQASDYFQCLDYAHLTELACSHHHDPAEGKSGSAQMIECALSMAKRYVYLSLDVMLVNYGVKPVPDRHYPKQA